MTTSQPGNVRLVHGTRPATGTGCFTGWGPHVPGI